MRDKDALIIALIMLKLCRNNFVAISTFICILVNIAGRGSETAILTFAELGIIPHEIDYQKSSIIQVLFRKDKTGHYQNPRIFPQADKNHWYKDLYFMLALSLIYRCAGIYREDTITPESPLVPKFFDEAKKEEKNTEKKNSSGTSLVSKKFGDIFKEVKDFFNAMKPGDPLFHKDPYLNPKLGSHSGKRHAALLLAECCTHTFAAIYRLGYLLQSVSFKHYQLYYHDFILFILYSHSFIFITVIGKYYVQVYLQHP